MIEQLKIYNSIFINNHSEGNKEAKEIFEYTNRSSRLILSAPHATRSFCNKKEKCADLYTGAIVKYLGEINNISTIVRLKYTPYKALISEYIENNNIENHLFLDIHGFNQDNGYDICLGTGYFDAKEYPNLQNIMHLIEKHSLKGVINHPDYMGKYGLTGRYQKIFNKPNVIQIEIKRYLRDFIHNPDTIKNITIPLLNEIISLYK